MTSPSRLLRGVLFLASALASTPHAADAASIRGAVTEPGTAAPLAAVDVVVRRAADSTAVVAHATTGPDGRFRLEGLAPDRYLLRATLLGHRPYVRRDLAIIEPSQDLDLGTIRLEVSPIAVPGADVHEARETAIVAPDRNIYLTKDMPAASTGTATEVLRSVPELDVDVDGNVSLRGSSSVNIQLNGRPAPMKGEALTNYLRQLPANRIERVEVIANPSAKFDPEGAAGIVNIVLKDQVGAGVSGSVNVVAGERNSSPGARVAWQHGPLTISGGGSATWNLFKNRITTLRESFAATSPSTVLWHGANEFENRAANLDAAIDYALTKRATLYGTLTANPNGNDPLISSRYAVFDSTGAESRGYALLDDRGASAVTASFTLGMQHVVQQGKNERTIEVIQNLTRGDSESDVLQLTDVPTGVPEVVSRLEGANSYRERAVQIDDTHTFGKKRSVKVETGYRGSERRTTNSSLLVAGAMSDDSDFAHRERFHSAYATLGSTFGKLSLQGGLRGETARTDVDAWSLGQHVDNDYDNLFPSANVAWDFGKGKQVRATYSKRIERPQAQFLNPDVPSVDSLNRFVGNPSLGPRYTHSYSIDASWTGKTLTLRASPYLRRTVDNWDQFAFVDAIGRATQTLVNASSVRTLGMTLTGSLRQTGRWGGTASVGVSREHHDASNITNAIASDVTGWTANGNVTFKATPKLDLQTFLRYSPARALAQGRASSFTFSSVAARWKLDPTKTVGLTVNDPFKLAKFTSVTGDATFAQAFAVTPQIRSVSASFNWTWGKSPQLKQRKQSAEAPPAAPDATPGP